VRLAERAGAVFSEAEKAAGALFEISPLMSYEGEDLHPLRGRSFKLPFELNAKTSDSA